MKLRLLSTMTLLMAVVAIWAQAPNNTGTYYQKADGKKGRELKTAFFEIIKNPSVVHYDSLWTAYNTSDKRVLNEQEIIWDMYSGISRYPLYTYPHGTGAGNTEGVKGIQREHSMPKKWFNPSDAPASGSKTYQDVRPMYSDLTHLIPTDAVCNNNRSDLCYGEVAEGQADWLSLGDETQGISAGFSKKSKQGGCATPGWAEQVADPVKTRVFEPNDEYKGDLARIYFYMATCYQPNYFSWVPVRNESKAKTGEAALLSTNHCGTWVSDMFNTAENDEGMDAYQPFAPWALDMLMKWSKNDPVSEKEKARNEAIWQFQGNRNPFVDYPGLEEYFWGDKKDEAFVYGGEAPAEDTSDNCETALNKSVLGVDWSQNTEPNQCDFWTRTPISFEKNGVTFTFSYGMEGRNLYADEREIRLYNYNTLTVTAHNNELTNIEVNVTGNNHASKTLVTSTGSLNNNVWTGSAQEVIFASNYVSSSKSGGVTKHYYLGLDNIKVTVANPSGIEQLKAKRFEDNRIYNMMGVEMDERNLAPGIYIKNGKKFVVKFSREFSR